MRGHYAHLHYREWILLKLSILRSVLRLEFFQILVVGNRVLEFFSRWMLTLCLSSADFRNFDELTHTVALLNDSNSYQMCLLEAAFNITPVPSGTNYTVLPDDSLSLLHASNRRVIYWFVNIGAQAAGAKHLRLDVDLQLTIPATLEGGTLYVVCTISGHCTEMQKIHGTVLAALGNASAPAGAPSPATSDADLNQYICWTTAILLIAACFWNSG
jgi:hypothetical protein